MKKEVEEASRYVDARFDNAQTKAPSQKLTKWSRGVRSQEIRVALMDWELTGEEHVDFEPTKVRPVYRRPHDERHYEPPQLRRT